MAFELETNRRNVPDGELIADLQRVASELGKKTVTRAEQDAKGRFNSFTLVTRFGGWFCALEKAGLERADRPKRIRDEELFKNLEGVWIGLGRQPRHREMHKPLSEYSGKPYEQRFGGWISALEAFISYINGEKGIHTDDGIEGPNVLQIPRRKAARNVGVEKTSSSVVSAEGSKNELTVIQRGPRNPGRRLILRVLMRDNGICQICKRAFTENGPDYHIDHITPWIKGGPTVLSNLQLLCSKCNLLKSDLDLTNGTEG
jgi:hypothetical protein